MYQSLKETIPSRKYSIKETAKPPFIILTKIAINNVNDWTLSQKIIALISDVRLFPRGK